MHVFLFDIDGTLLSSGGAGKAAMVAALESVFGVTEPSDSVPLSGRTDRTIARDLFRLHRIEDTPANWQQFVSAYLQHLPDCLIQHKGKILPGISSLLETLVERTATHVGLLTGNLREGARLKLERYSLYHHFAFGAFGDHYATRDEVAHEALATVRSHCNGSLCLERLWVIGDTPLDIQCARAIGARVVAVATGSHSLEQLAADTPDLLLADLSDPSPLLSLLD